MTDTRKADAVLLAALRKAFPQATKNHVDAVTAALMDMDVRMYDIDELLEWTRLPLVNRAFTLYQVFERGELGDWPWGSPFYLLRQAKAKADENNQYYKSVGRTFVVKSRRIESWHEA